MRIGQGKRVASGHSEQVKERLSRNSDLAQRPANAAWFGIVQTFSLSGSRNRILRSQFPLQHRINIMLAPEMRAISELKIFFPE